MVRRLFLNQICSLAASVKLSVRARKSATSCVLPLVLLPFISTASATPPLDGVDVSIVGIHPRDAGRMDLTWPEVGGSVAAFVEVRNSSNIALNEKAEVVCSLHRGKTVGGQQVGSKVLSTAESMLGGGQSQVIRVLLPKVDRSSHFSVGCRLDPLDRIAETDEQNNASEVSFKASLRNSNMYAVELMDFGKNWATENSGHRRLDLMVYQPGGIDQPQLNFTNFKLGWQADCRIPAMPWTRVRKRGHMGQLPFGELPGRQNKSPVSMWLWPVQEYGKPPLSSLPPVLPVTCELVVGAFKETRVAERVKDLRPAQVFWKESVQYQIANTESALPVKDDALPIGEIYYATETLIAGWACDTDTPDRSVTVNLSLAGRKVKVTANESSDESVRKKCGGGNAHGFSYDLSESDVNYLRGKALAERQVSASAENSNEFGKPGNLDRSPMDIAISQGALDLVLLGIHPRDAGRMDLTWPEVGGAVAAFVEVRNNSADFLPEKVEVECSLHRGKTVGGEQVGNKVSAAASSALDARTSQVIRVLLPNVDRSSHFSIKCQLDPRQRLAESNKQNNVNEVSFKASLRNSNKYAVELMDVSKTLVTESSGKSRLDLMVYQPGGIDQPQRNFTNFKLGWQADCEIPVLPWTLVRKWGHMGQLPFGELPGRQNKSPVSFWIWPLSYVGSPRIEEMPPTLSLVCNLAVGAFKEDRVAEGVTDLRPAQTFWEEQKLVFELANPGRQVTK